MSPETNFGSSVARWEHFPHGADLGIRGFGPTPAEAFVHAASAMCAAIVDLAMVRCDEAIDIEREAASLAICFSWSGSTPSSTRWPRAA